MTWSSPIAIFKAATLMGRSTSKFNSIPGNTERPRSASTGMDRRALNSDWLIISTPYPPDAAAGGV